jgi:SAM-dependent methyltransferase
MAAMERNDGIRRLLLNAPVYRLSQRLIGANKSMSIIARDIVRAAPTDRVVDMGCGPAELAGHLDAADYIGFDPNPRYVDDARRRFGDQITVLRGGIGDAELESRLPASTDVVVAIGVLHHLDDELADAALALARRLVSGGGRFVAVDPGLVDGQHRVARALVTRDRGQHVRTIGVTRELVDLHFPSGSITARHDLLHVPYSHIVVEAAA